MWNPTRHIFRNISLAFLGVRLKWGDQGRNYSWGWVAQKEWGILIKTGGFEGLKSWNFKR